MSETINLSPSLRSLYVKIPVFVHHYTHSQFLSSPFRSRKSLGFSENFGLLAKRIQPIYAREQEGCLQDIDDSPVSIELISISSEEQFDRAMADAQELGESVVIVWMAAWCRKCIYLKPKLEKLAAEFIPRLRFYRVDVNAVPYRLVSRAGVTKMPTIQLWRNNEKQGEVIGGHKAHFVIDDVRQMIENDSTI